MKNIHHLYIFPFVKLDINNLLDTIKGHNNKFYQENNLFGMDLNTISFFFLVYGLYYIMKEENRQEELFLKIPSNRKWRYDKKEMG